MPMTLFPSFEMSFQINISQNSTAKSLTCDEILMKFE